MSTISGEKVAKLLAQMIRKRAKRGDYYQIRDLYCNIVIYYSRYYSGGTYEHIGTLTFWKDRIDWYNYEGEGRKEDTFDIADPQCFDQIIDKIIGIASKLGLDREKDDFMREYNVLKRPKISILHGA